MPRLWPKGGLWRHPDFLKLWSATTVSQFGTQVSGLALPLVALLIPAVAFAGAYVLWRLVPCESGACLHTRAPAWLLAALAVPTALLGGVPFEGGLPRYVVIAATRVVNMNRLGAALLGEVTDPPVMALYVFGANPATSSPNAGKIVEGLQRDDLFMFDLMHRAMRIHIRSLARAIDGLVPGDAAGARQLQDWYAHVESEIVFHHSVEDDIYFPGIVASVPAYEATREVLHEDHEELDVRLSATRVALDDLAMEVSGDLVGAAATADVPRCF